MALNSVQSKMLLCGCSEQDAMMWLFRARCYDEVFQSKRLGCGCSKKEAGFWLFRRLTSTCGPGAGAGPRLGRT